MNATEHLFRKDPLLPTVVSDAATGAVLMLGWSNAESLRSMMETGSLTLWSRSRNELWVKGATSGNTQRVTEVHLDCDGDALLVKVLPDGPICHTGAPSCFFQEIKEFKGVEGHFHEAPADSDLRVLHELSLVIQDRKRQRPEGSYTTYLFEKGLDKILKKVGEESAETIIAAKNQDNEELTREAADLLYHLLVLFAERELPLEAVFGELAQRQGKKKKEKSQPEG